MMIPSGSGPVSIKDDKSNNYLMIPYGDDGTNLLVGFYPDPDAAGHGLISNAPQTITLTTLVAVSGFFWLNMAEFSPPTGAVAVSMDGSQVAPSTSGASTPTFQVLNNDVLLFAASFSTGASTTGSGWTADAGSGTGQCSEYKIVNAGAPNALFATQTGTSWMGVFGLAPVRRNQWVPLQAVWNHAGSAGTSISASLNAPIGAGNYILGAFANNTGPPPDLTSLVDDKGNNYLPNVQTPNTNGRCDFWLGPIPAGGPKTITATVSPTSTALYLQFAEFRPPPNATSATLDAYLNTQPSGASSPVNSGNLTTTGTMDLVFNTFEASSGGGIPSNNYSTINGYFSTWNMSYLNQPTPSGTVSVSYTFITSSAINFFVIALAPQFPQVPNTYGTSFYRYGGV
jgi:hypothetical protein